MDFHSSRTKVDGYRLTIGYLGVAAMLIGTILLLPLVFLIAFPEEIPYAGYFIGPGAASIIIGYLLSLFVKGKKQARLRQNQDSQIVVSTWIIAVLVSAIPFMLTGRYDFAQAVFETTSGYTTTGLSIVDVEKCPNIFLAFRSIMHFSGGIGFMLVMASVFSDRNGMRLDNTGDRTDRQIPYLLKSLRIIVSIYSGYIISGAILYMVAGMGWFDALNHSIAAVTTGGFSTKAQSIGFYDSFLIETITIVLMLLGATNFLVHLLIFKGKIAGWARHCETRLSSILIVLAAPAVGLFLVGTIALSLPEAARLALFQTVSALTTTGLRTASDFSLWPSSSLLILLLLMLTGGGAGSTAGGIKQARLVILLKSLWWEMRHKFNPKRILKAPVIRHYGAEDDVIDEDRCQTGLFIILYLAIFALGTMAYCFFGYSLRDSAFEFASALGTVGFTSGITRFGAPSGVLWIGTMGMLLGRMEIYYVILSFAKVAKDSVDALRGRYNGA